MFPPPGAGRTSDGTAGLSVVDWWGPSAIVVNELAIFTVHAEKCIGLFSAVPFVGRFNLPEKGKLKVNPQFSS